MAQTNKFIIGIWGVSLAWVKGRSKSDSSYLRTKNVTKAYFTGVDLCTQLQQRQDIVRYFHRQRQNSHIQVILTF